MRALVLVMVAWLASPVAAHDLWRGYPAYAFGAAPVDANAVPQSIGFSFTVSESTKVAALGYWDQGADGFVDTHDVGLFVDGLPSPIAQVQFSLANPGQLGRFGRVFYAGDGDALGGWRYQRISTLDLHPGLTYTIAGFSPGAGDPWAYGSVFVQPYPYGRNIIIDVARYDATMPGLVNPTVAFADGRLFAAVNLLAVPEPASWAMLITGFGLVGAAARRRRIAVA